MLVLCRNCSGCTGVKLGGDLLSHCQPFVEEGKKSNLVKTNRQRNIVGKKARVTRREIQRLKEEFRDCSFMAQIGTWHFMEQRMRDVRRGQTKEN